MPLSTPLKLADPGKNAKQGTVVLVGFTVAVPVMKKSPLPPTVQAVISRLSWQVKPLPAGACAYCANWQSPVVPEVTPPPKAHQPQKPKPCPVPGATPVPAKPICQFSAPYARAGVAAKMRSVPAMSTPSRGRNSLDIWNPPSVVNVSLDAQELCLAAPD